MKAFDAYKESEKECETDLKEIAHFYGGWDELKKVIDRLQDNANEAAFDRWAVERYCGSPDAWDGGIADNH